MTDQDKPARRAGRSVARKRRCNRWNEKRRQIFLASLNETANVRHSAEQAKMSMASAYLLKKRDPAFELAWREALEIGYCEVEMALLRQALKGSERVERLEEGEERTLKYVKTVQSFPFTVAVRLYMSHRDEVLAFRRSRDGEDESGPEPGQSVADRTRAYLDEIDARLRASERGAERDECGGE